jgi:spore cortex protein
MKKSLIIIAILIFSLDLAGCARNNANDKVAYRNNNGTAPTRVNYNPNGGPAITGVDTSNRNINRNDLNDNRSKMRVADDAADRVTDLPEVDSANVIVTDNNAYVAAKLAGSSRNELTSAVEHKIVKRVKSVDPDIDNVYVSVNPDFYGQMNSWAGDIRNGRPVSGFFKQFSDAVRRVFPDLKR